MQIIKGKYFLNENGFTIKSTDDSLLDEYLWQYLLSIKSELYNLCGGAAQKVVSKDNLYSIKIPIPPIETQREIIKKYDQLYNLTNDFNEMKQVIEKQKEDYLKSLFNCESPSV